MTIEVEHEETIVEGEKKSESFWLKIGENRMKVLNRDEIVGAFKYVLENPEKFKETT